MQKQNSKVNEFSLLKSIEETIAEMIRDKEENPSLIIPYSFLESYNSPQMLELFKAIYEYCKNLHDTEIRVEALKEEGKSLEAHLVYDSSSKVLHNLGKAVAQKYGELILTQRLSKTKFDDQNFFETVIYFIARVLQPAFEKTKVVELEEEINRLFRGTAFNLSERKHKQDEKKKTFPELKVSQRKDPDTVINSIIMRQKHKNLKIESYGKKDSFLRPAYVKLTPYRAINSRSPLISMILPSPRDRILTFEMHRKKKRTTQYPVI